MWSDQKKNFYQNGWACTSDLEHKSNGINSHWIDAIFGHVPPHFINELEAQFMAHGLEDCAIKNKAADKLMG